MEPDDRAYPDFHDMGRADAGSVRFGMEKRDRMMEESPVKLIRTRRFGDERGWFSETYVESRWMELGANARFVQDNHSYSRPQGTIRGIHFQSPPHAQAKLIRCVRGRIMDYAVDLRRSSPTFGHHVSAELTADNGDQRSEEHTSELQSLMRISYAVS